MLSSRLPSAGLVGLDGGELFQVHAPDQFVMHGGLQRVARAIAQEPW